jgi:hypothetical protein
LHQYDVAIAMLAMTRLSQGADLTDPSERSSEGLMR